MMQIECSTGAHADPSDVLDAVDAQRRAMRSSYHYRQQCDDRWTDLRQYACWMPCWDGSMWSAKMRGVIYLGCVAEVRYEDEVGTRHGVRLVPFTRTVIHADVRDHVFRSMTVITGIKVCSDYDVSSMMSEIDRRGGYKPLLFRRNMQGN